jgi:type I protein arginine methyltransferase
VKPAAISKGFLRTPDSKAVITNSACVLDLDLQNIEIPELNFDSIPFRLVANRCDTVHAFLAWFDYDFTAGSQHLHTSTGPYSKPTHWKQTVFYLENPLRIHEGQVITGHISFQQSQRDLNVRLVYELVGNSTNGAASANGSAGANGAAGNGATGNGAAGNGAAVNGTKVLNGTTATSGHGVYKV